MTWYHNLKWTITWGHIISDNECSKLPKTHLQKFSYSVNRLLKFHCFKLVFSFYWLAIEFIFSKLWFFWFLKRIVSQLFYYSYHLCDWHNNYSFSVRGKHKRADGHNDAGKNCSVKLHWCFIHDIIPPVKSCISNQLITIFNLTSLTLVRHVSHQGHFINS